jgi:hypothetical protein
VELRRFVALGSALGSPGFFRGKRTPVTERIKAVQRMFWAMLGASLVVALLGLPVGHDGDTMAALEEVRAFAAGFDRAALERALVSGASAQGVVGLDTVARATSGSGVPKVSAAPSAPPIAPRAAVSLATLADVHGLTAPGATLAIGSPKAEAVALALAWRLSRHAGPQGYELQSIILGDGRCTQTDVGREQEVVDARAAALEARKRADAADKQHAQAQDVYDLRRKWKAPWKAIAKANETRIKTQAALEQAQQQLAQLEQAYEALAKRAESFETNGGGKQAPAAQHDAAECAVAIATLVGRPSGEKLELHLPAAIDRRPVAVPRITGADFPVTRAAGLWDELASGTAEQALQRLGERFSWHYRYFEVAGIKLGGMTVLQLVPLALLPIFLLLMRRSRGVGATYNPFDRPNVESLPTVGFGIGALNLLVLVVLPLAGCVLCAFSLAQIDQLPIVPVLCAFAALGLGGSCHVALKELLELRDAITRSHSNPPPAPAR